MKQFIIPFVIFLSVFGILFLGLLAHEAIHILQSKSPQSICYDMQQDTFMSIHHNPEDFADEELQDFKTYTEKWAAIVSILVLIMLSFALGFFSDVLYWRLK